ncbi:MAG: hypothetical protein OCD76_19255 [Reichenbachiella sp.]
MVSQGDYSFKKYSEYLKLVTMLEKDEIDFLVIDKNYSHEIHKISNGQIDTFNNTSWIGDKEGFEQFQREFLPEVSSKKSDEELYYHFEKSFSNTLLANIHSIGHFSITAFYKEKFKYTWKFGVSNSPSFMMPGNIDSRYVLDRGSKADGSYAFFRYECSAGCIWGVAFHFPHINYGILFSPQLQLISPRKYNKKNIEQFSKSIKSDYGLIIEGQTQNDQGLFGIVGTKKQKLKMNVAFKFDVLK